VLARARTRSSLSEPTARLTSSRGGSRSALPVHGPHAALSVASPCDCRCQGVERVQVCGRQLNAKRTGVFLHPFGSRRTWNRNDVGTARQAAMRARVARVCNLLPVQAPRLSRRGPGSWRFSPETVGWCDASRRAPDRPSNGCAQ
jgi:hypothetical protein